MSRKSTRAAIASYLTGANIEYLGAVFPQPPKFTKEGEFVENEGPGAGVGAVIYIHLSQQMETRITIGPQGIAKKVRQYGVQLICVLRWKGTESQDAGDANDDFLDSLTEAIQANRTAGSSSIFQWGEGDQKPGTLDIHVDAGMPRPIRQQTSQVYSTVNVMALEILDT